MTQAMWTIPNLLTMARILAAPALAVIYAVFDAALAHWIALVVFVGAALTDFVDGWLARALNQTSAIGKMLDPIADKVMVMIALALLLALFGAEAWITIPVAVIFTREVLVSGLREYLGQVALSVTTLAKWKTTAQMTAIAGLFLTLALAQVPPAPANLATDGVTATLVWASPMDGYGLQVALASIGLLWVAAILTAITG
ncbi:MAG: CDP-diacylglycerol--glycerol-3-phosphate 3-phosphatidyltransferase, partial [Pseudomonadota bacterium]